MNGATCKKYAGNEDTDGRWQSYKIDRDSKVTGATLLFKAGMRGAPISKIKAKHNWFPASQADSPNDASLHAATRVAIHDLFGIAPPAPEYVLAAMILSGEVNLLAAHGGVGKSYLALLLAIHIAIGRAFAGSKVKQLRVLFLSCEDRRGILQYRQWRIMQHYGIGSDDLGDNLVILDATDCDPVLYREDRNGGEVTKSYSDLQALCAEHEAEVLIIDNASDTFDANEISRPRVRAFLRSLRQLSEGLTVLLLSHVDKATAKAGGGSEGYSGSTAWNNSVRSRLLMSVDDTGRVKLEQQKNNYGPCGAPILLEWVDGVLVPLPPGADESAQQADMDVVLDLIKELFNQGEFVSPKDNSPNRAWRKLSTHTKFPARLNDARLKPLLRKAVSEGKLTQEEYTGADRKPRQRWVVVGGMPNPWE